MEDDTIFWIGLGALVLWALSGQSASAVVSTPSGNTGVVSPGQPPGVFTPGMQLPAQAVASMPAAEADPGMEWVYCPTAGTWEEVATGTAGAC